MKPEHSYAFSAVGYHSDSLEKAISPALKCHDFGQDSRYQRDISFHATSPQ